MPTRELDTGRIDSRKPSASPAAGASRRLRLDGADAGRRLTGDRTAPSRPEADPNGAALAADPAMPPSAASVVSKALAMVRSERAGAAGFATTAGDESTFVADPVPQRTSSAAEAVHLQQFYRGLPVFRAGHTVRFGPQGRNADVVGESLVLQADFDTAPTILARQAGLVAAQHLASTGGERVKDEFGEVATVPGVSLDGFEPQIIAGFPTLPSQPTVLEWVATAPADGTQTPPAAVSKPFENAVPAHLLLFDQPAGQRLGWHMIFTFTNYADQYVVIVSADAKAGEILYARSMMHRAKARGNVFEFSPAVADRRMIDMPRPITDYPVMPSIPLVGFPVDWVSAVDATGNSTLATLNFTRQTLSGTQNGSIVEFDPQDRFGDNQKLLNIFYFCNYMHDFLYVLGFDEAAGNFQQTNLTHMGVGGDPVRARAHSGAVEGTANMSTAADGLPPVMNMGLVTSSRNHTAFDADVVFHEYTHGLTNRLVGGTRQANALDAPQSQGMGEGWSDYFALTIQNYFRAQAGRPEKTVLGEWVVQNDGGIRSAPYDDDYPNGYGDLAGFPRDPRTDLPDEHQTGEVWCAALMMMTRRIRAVLGNDADGYRLAWQMVVDGLKLTPANPTFLQARDAILMALDHMLGQRRISQATHQGVLNAARSAFGRFGMGPNAESADAGVDGITADVVAVVGA